MKLSRVIDSLDQIPNDLHENYVYEADGRYVLKVDGMVANKELKEFRKNNIELIKVNAQLLQQKNELEDKIKRLEDEASKEKDRKVSNVKDSLVINQETVNHLVRVNSTYKRLSTLKETKKTNAGITLEWIDKNNFKFGEANIRVEGKIIRIGRLRSEGYVDLSNPELIIDMLKKDRPRVDIFTFIQPIFEKIPLYENYYEMDNVAAIPITTYDNWWNNQIKDKTRNLIRKAKNNGILVEKVPLGDELIKGIVEIFNETPIRQGRPYNHYGKDFDTVKKEISTFPDNSDFIGAFVDGKLIGFIKMVYNGRTVSLMQILSMIKHRDKAPTNALLSKAVEISAQNGIEYLIYRRFIYGKKGADKLTEFKMNNGFQKYDVPRYFLGITAKGKIALKLKLHKNPTDYIPTPVYSFLLRGRDFLNSLRAMNYEG